MNFFNSFADKLDFWVIGIVLCSGFFQQKYMEGFYLSKNNRLDGALKTLLVSTLASCAYIFLLKDPDSANNWAKYFVSYFAATSLYELLVTPFVRWLKRVTGQNEEPKP